MMFFIAGIFFMQFYKLAVKDTPNKNISAVIMQFIAGISILLLSPFFEFKFSHNWKIYGLLGLASVFYALNDRMQVTIRKNLDVSIYSMLGQISKVFMFFYGIILFQEKFIISRAFGAFLIISGSVATFYKKGKLKWNIYATMAFLASFFCATGFIIDVGISDHFNIPLYIMITFIIPGILIYFYRKFSFKELSIEFNSKRKKYYFITGLAWGLDAFFFIRAMQLGDVTIVAPLSSLIILINVVTAYFLHKEKDGIAKKILAALVIITGIFFLLK